MTVRADAGAGASGSPGPWAALWERHGAIAAAAWRQRHATAGERRSADERAFLPAALSLQETPAHPAPRRLACLLMALFALALAWAWIGTVDIVAVATGRIIVDERNKLIQPLERSVVRRVLVRDGDHVVPGQPLVELDATTVRADKTSVLQQLRAAGSERLRTRLLQQALRDALAHAPQVSTADLRHALDAGEPLDAGALAHEQAAVQRQLADEWHDIVARQARLAAESHRRQAEVATAQAMVDKLEATLPLIRQREHDLQVRWRPRASFPAMPARTVRANGSRWSASYWRSARACRRPLPRTPKPGPARPRCRPRSGAPCRSGERRLNCAGSRRARN